METAGARSLIHVLVFSALLIPYARLFPFQSDIQPQVTLIALLAGGYAFLVAKERHYLLAIPAFSVPFVGVLAGSAAVEIVRALAIYGGVYLLFLYFRHAIERGMPPIFMLKALFLLCLFAGLLQAGFGAYVLDWIIPARTSETRGVTALTVEPSFYGLIITLVAIAIVVFSESRAEKIAVTFLAAVQVFALSRSPLAMLVFVAAFSALAVLRSGHPIRSMALMLGGGMTLLVAAALTPTRAGDIIGRLLANPLTAIASDASMSDRFSHIALPIIGSAKSLFLPNGFSAFVPMLARTDWPLYVSKTEMIMSGYGAAIFHLGIFAAPFLYYNFRFLRSDADRQTKLALLALALTTLMVFTNAIGMALPLYALTLAILNSPTLWRQQYTWTGAPS